MSTMSGAACGERLEPRTDRILTGGPTRDRSEETQARGRALEGLAIVWMDHRLDERDLAMAGKRRQGALNGRSPGQRPVLLGNASAGAQPASGGDHHCCDRSCHPLHPSRLEAGISASRGRRKPRFRPGAP